MLAMGASEPPVGGSRSGGDGAQISLVPIVLPAWASMDQSARAEAARRRVREAQELGDAAWEKLQAVRKRASQVLEPFEGQDRSEPATAVPVAGHGEARDDEGEDIADQLSQKLRRSARRSRDAGVRQEGLCRSATELAHQGTALRAWTADIAAVMAEGAEGFAEYLENRAVGDRERRLAVAKAEHEVARIQTRTAARLRDLNTRYERGERLPNLPGPTSRPMDPPAGPGPDEVN